MIRSLVILLFKHLFTFFNVELSFSCWQVTREYREHCEAIEAKIVGVMSDTLERQFATWEARSPVPSPAFNGILKAVSKLHEAVSGVLPPQQVGLSQF